MATLLGADGRPLTSTRPAAASGTDLVSAVFGSRSQWTDRDPWGDGVGWLKSYNDIYRSQPVISAVVDKLTRRISTLPLGAFTEEENGSRDPLPRSNGLQTLLRRPIPGWSTVHLLAHVAQSLLVHGNAIVAKRRTTGRDGPVDELWALDWSQMAAYAPEGGRIEVWSTTQFGGVERFINRSDIIHFAWPAPDGGEIGVSPLEKLSVTIRLEDAAQRYQTASFRNGARPSMALLFDNKDFTKEQRDHVDQQMRALHAGVDQNSKTLVLSGGARVESLSLNPVEVALIEQRKLDREEVGMVYDLAGPLMNDLTHGTYSNVEELNRGLYRDVIPPWTSMIVETLEAQLVDLEPNWSGSLVRFDFTDKLRGEPAEQALKLKTEVDAGLRTRDEARKELGLPPVGGNAGELTVMANNVAPIDSVGEETSGPSAAVEGPVVP